MTTFTGHEDCASHGDYASHSCHHQQATQRMLSAEEIDELVSQDGQPDETLGNVVALVGNRFEADVCSVYLLEPDRAHLLLAATVGLNQNCVGVLRMGVTEGLAGLVAQQVGPVAVEEAARHHRFKYFPEAEEDAYESFLGVPLIENELLQGVLVVQTTEPCRYTSGEIQRLVDVAGQLVPVLSAVRRLEQFATASHRRSRSSS